MKNLFSKFPYVDSACLNKLKDNFILSTKQEKDSQNDSCEFVEHLIKNSFEQQSLSFVCNDDQFNRNLSPFMRKENLNMGILVEQIHCGSKSCEKKFYITTFSILYLSFKDNKTEISLEELISQNFEEESRQCVCDFCGVEKKYKQYFHRV